MYIKTSDLKLSFAGIKILKLDLTFGIAIHSISKISIKPLDIKILGTTSDFFIWSKCNTDRTMRNLFMNQTFCHRKNLGNPSFIIRTKDRCTIRCDQSTALERRKMRENFRIKNQTTISKRKSFSIIIFREDWTDRTITEIRNGIHMRNKSDRRTVFIALCGRQFTIQIAFIIKIDISKTKCIHFFF